MTDVRRAMRHSVPYDLMRCDGLAEGCALHAVVRRRLQRRLRDSKRLGSDADAPAVQRRHGDFEAWTQRERAAARRGSGDAATGQMIREMPFCIMKWDWF